MVGDRHFGLQGIKERARLMGGTAMVESSPGHGTKISVAIPLMLDGKQT